MLELTATELSRFMVCNGFKSLKGIEPFNPSTEQTDEGNTAHWAAEQIFKGVEPSDLSGKKAPTGMFVTDEMLEYCKNYFDFIKSGNVEVETDTSHSGHDWEIHGRADSVKIENSVLTVADLKYGWRIVEPERNWTLISHAIGWHLKHGSILVTKVKFVIFQPRPFHPKGTVREWEIDYPTLMKYYDELNNVLEHPSETVCTSSSCYKCKALALCPAAQNAVMNAIDISQKAFNSEISDDRLGWMLCNLKRAQEIIKQNYDAYEDLALHRLKDGKSVKGYSIKQAFGQTAWNKDVTPEFIKAVTGVDVSVTKLMTPVQAKKAGLTEMFVNSCTHRPDNGLKLVAVDENELAQKLFGKKEN